MLALSPGDEFDLLRTGSSYVEEFNELSCDGELNDMKLITNKSI